MTLRIRAPVISSIDPQWPLSVFEISRPIAHWNLRALRETALLPFFRQ